MDVDSEDDDDLSFSVPLDLASTNQLSASTSPSAGPSASTLTITPLHQVTATADSASHQALCNNVSSLTVLTRRIRCSGVIFGYVRR